MNFGPRTSWNRTSWNTSASVLWNRCLFWQVAFCRPESASVENMGPGRLENPSAIVRWDHPRGSRLRKWCNECVWNVAKPRREMMTWLGVPRVPKTCQVIQVPPDQRVILCHKRRPLFGCWKIPSSKPSDSGKRNILHDLNPNGKPISPTSPWTWQELARKAQAECTLVFAR